ncbi:hypothetical protein J6590_101555, partial [Homalodisca vitripennis]
STHRWKSPYADVGWYIHVHGRPRRECLYGYVCEETVRKQTFYRGFLLISTTQLVRPGRILRLGPNP